MRPCAGLGAGTREAALALIRACAADARWAPRHMHRVKPWRKRLEEAGIPAVLRCTAEAPPPPMRCSSLGRLRELGQLYRLADAVFVGGGLRPLRRAAPLWA
ncbi:MAG: hypothetical protein V8Q84_03310 [Bilophila sp.]